MAFTVINLLNGDANIQGLVLAKGERKSVPFLTKPLADARRRGTVSITPDVTGAFPRLVNGASAYATVDGVVPNPTDFAKTQQAVGNLANAVIKLTGRLDSLEKFIHNLPMPQDGAVKP